MRKVIDHKNCTHEHMKDFSCWSFGDNVRVSHHYCPDCKAHWFRDKFYTAAEWEVYVNDIDVGHMPKTFDETVKANEDIFIRSFPGPNGYNRSL